MTFASSHVYPGGAARARAANATSLVNDNNTRVSQITSGGYTTATVKSFNTEWNSSYSRPGRQHRRRRSRAWTTTGTPAFILKGVKLLSDKNAGDTPPLDVFSYWVLSDVFDESSGPSGSYILGQGGNLPFGQVFGLMTFQGVRKAAFNAFKMLNYLGPKRLMSGGGTGGDGVDAMATMSASGDELQILVYNYFATLNTTGTDNVTVNVSNLPAALAGKEVFVTHFRVDETHSNPYSVWTEPGQPHRTRPRRSGRRCGGSSTWRCSSRSARRRSPPRTRRASPCPGRRASLLILGREAPGDRPQRPRRDRGRGLRRPVGRDQGRQQRHRRSGQSIAGDSGSYVYFENVDFSDAGVGAVQLRVNAQSATTLELHADSQTGPLLGTCAVPRPAAPGPRRRAR